VGESGCGKSVTAHSIIQLIPVPPGRIVGGQILFEGHRPAAPVAVAHAQIRGNRISMIFQEPMTSLNPVFSVGEQVAEVIRLHQGLGRGDAIARVVEMFQLVGIPAADQRLREYPHQMSGGMRQRVMIAMALACNPRLMIADEPTTALDVTIQAQILDLMNRLKNETGASILFITHDLGVIAEMAQHVAVMYAGKVWNTRCRNPFRQPQTPLHHRVAALDPGGRGRSRGRRLSTIPGTVPSLFNLPPGCLFSDRCPDAFADCRRVAPQWSRWAPTTSHGA
jgi:oligopeptide/dipeptide ABC transporter ATP-binding protein